MKKFLTTVLCLLFGGYFCYAGDSQSHLTNQYVFSSIVASGIPDMSPQFAAFGMFCNLNVYKLNQDQLIVKITGVSVGKANQKFKELNPDEIPSHQHTLPVYQEQLIKPFAINFNSEGLIENLSVSRNDAEWSVNFKIGLASLFEIYKVSAQSNYTVQVRKNKHQKTSTVVETMEPTFAGNCKTIYNFQTKHQSQSGPRQMKIKKIRDYETCFDKPYFANSCHRGFKCNSHGEDDAHALSRNTEYKYSVEVDDEQNYHIKRAESNGVVRFAPLGQDADALSVIHKQILKMRPVQMKSQAIPLLIYPLKTVKPYSNLWDKLDIIRQPTDLDTPIIFNQLYGGRSQFSAVRKLIISTGKLMARGPSTNDHKHILASIPEIQFGLTSLSYSDLLRLADVFRVVQNNDDKLIRKFFYEMVAITSTNPCIKLIMEATKANLINKQESASLMPSISAHVANPNVLLLDNFMNFCQSRDVKNNKELYISCVLTFGNLVAKTCAENVYQFPKGPRSYCPTDKLQLYVTTMEYEVEITDSEDILLALMSSLSNMAVEQVIPTLLKYAQHGDERVTKFVQLKAMVGLVLLAKQYPKLLEKELLSMVITTQDPELRTAAFRVLMASHPSPQIYEQIAMLTNYDNDQTFKAAVYSVFKVLATSTHPCLKDASGHAKLALRLMKDKDSKSWIASDYHDEGTMKHLEVHSLVDLMVFGESGSLTPNRMSARFENFISDFTSNLLLMGYFGRNVSAMVDRLIGSSAILEGNNLMDRLRQLKEPLTNFGIDKLLQKVGNLPNDKQAFDAYIFTRIMDFQQSQYHVNKNFLDSLINSGKSAIKLRQNGFDIAYNFLRTFSPLHVQLTLPIDAGFNVNLLVKTSMQLAVNLDAAYTAPQDRDQSNYNFQSQFYTQLATNTFAEIGVVLPAENNFVGVGYDVTLIANPLVGGQVEVDVKSDEVHVLMVPQYDHDDGTIWYYKNQPYTTIYDIFKGELKKNEKITIQVSETNKYEIPILDNVLTVKVEKDDDTDGLEDNIKENSVYGFLSFWWSNQQFRLRKYQLERISPQLPALSYNLNWNYTPSKSQPESEYRSVWYMIWQALAGWADISIENQEQEEAKSHVEIAKKLLYPFVVSLGSQESEESKEEKIFNKYLEEQNKRNKDSVQLSASKIGKGVSTLTTSSTVRITMDNCIYGYDTYLDMSEDHERDSRITFGLKVLPFGDVSLKTVCLVGEKIRSRKQGETHVSDITGRIAAQYGVPCYKIEPTIFGDFRMNKSEEQLQGKNQPWFYKQCVEDEAKGQPWSYACMQENEDKSRLNHFEASLRYLSTHRVIYNITKQIEQYLMIKLHNHYSSSHVHNTPDHIKVVANYHENVPVVDFQIEEPDQTSKFTNVLYDKNPFALPPNSAKSKTQQVLDYWSDNTLTPKCTFGDDYVTGFNNVTFDFEQEIGCEYLFSADCSDADNFDLTVLRESENSKILKLRVLTTLIEINPRSEMNVVINQQRYSLKDNAQLVVLDDTVGPRVIAVIAKESRQYKVIMTFIRMSIQFDGKHTQLTTSNLWANPLCGICGRYEAVNSNSFKGPGNQIYTNGNDFAQAYAEERPGSTCKASKSEARKMDLTEDNCLLKSKPFVRTNIKEDHACLGTQLYDQCAEGCVATSGKYMMIPYYCIKVDDISKYSSFMKELKKRNHFGKRNHFTKASLDYPVLEPTERPLEGEMSYYLPDRCAPATH